MNYRKADAKAASRAQFRGVWAAVTTPFTPDLGIDEAGLRANMRHLTRNLKVDGVFCTGVMGEFWALTKAERQRVVEIVVEEAHDPANGGHCKVIAHTGHHCAHETVEQTLHAEAVGADFAILMTPYYPVATEAAILDWFGFVADRVEMGIWLFDTPFSGTPALSPALTARLADIPNICGAKIARPLAHYVDVKRLCGDKLVISSPSEGDLLMLMREHGQRVHQSSASPYLLQTATRQPVRDYVELALAGRFDEAAVVSATLAPAREVVRRWLIDPFHHHKLIPIAAIKAWSEHLGMAGGPVRPGLEQLTAEQRGGLRADLERIGLAGGGNARRAAAE